LNDRSDGQSSDNGRILLSRRNFLTQASAAGLSVRGAGAAPRPNILWISCEDTGPQIGCYGDSYALTPNIDRLASQGVRYSHAYTVAGVCAPSRSGIITGMYPSSLGSQYMRCKVTLPEQVKCFPEYLRNAGYYCTNNVKTDYNFDVPAGAWNEVSRTAHWKNRNANQPFFAVFNFETTHESQVRKRGAEYDKMIASLSPAERREPSKAVMPPYYPDTPESRKDWAQYYELITAMDKQAGNLLKELEAAGLLEDTVVFFWGDHGVGLPRAKRWLYESSTHVPLVIRIPEKFRTTGQGKPGSVDDQLVSFIDLGPTVLNLAAVPLPGHLQGRAFLGTKLTAPRRYVYGARDRMDETYDSVRMVRDRRYRYLRNYQPHLPYAQYLSYMEQGNIMKELRRLAREDRTPGAAQLFMSESKPVEELYDVASDPHELRNLAGSAAHKSILERMRSVQEEWAIDTRDVGLIPEPEVDTRGRAAGSRYAMLRQPGSDRYLRELRLLVDAVNRGTKPELVSSALTHKDPAFRYWSITAYTKTAQETEKARDRVIAAMTDAAPVVRIAAARAAALHLGNEEALKLLARELDGENEWTCLHAAQGLEALGKRALPARGELKQAAEKKRNDYVVRVATHTLELIG
jgi:arylsulfatase A-like enzyme